MPADPACTGDPVDVVERMFTAFANDDLDACAAAFAEDATVIPVTIPDSPRGRLGVLEALRTIRRQGRRFTFRIDETTASGDRVLTVALMVEETSAGLIEIPLAWVFRLNCNKITFLEGFYTRQQALERMERG
jgi:limonene-1,2-epoxide hydrolase